MRVVHFSLQVTILELFVAVESDRLDVDFRTLRQSSISIITLPRAALSGLSTGFRFDACLQVPVVLIRLFIVLMIR